MKKFLTLAAMFMVIAGCKVCEPIYIEKDSVRIVEVNHHDTIIVTRADSAQVRLFLRCDSANHVLIDEISTTNGERLRMQLQLQALVNGTIATIDCDEDSLLNVIHWQDSIIRTNTNQTIVKEIKVVPSFYKNCTIAMWIIIVILALAIVGRILIKIFLHK